MNSVGIGLFDMGIGDPRQNFIAELLRNRLFWAIVALGFLLRLYLALTTIYIWDEEQDWLPAALSISFDPDNINLPIRAENHGALSAYFIKLGSLLFGENILGFRIVGIAFGVATIVLVALITTIWAGPTAAIWAAVLMAFNEYHVAFSMFAIQKSYYLFFAAAATFTFVLSLQRNRPALLYATAFFLGLAFLSYEIAALLVPVFFLTIVFSRHRAWLLTRYNYISFVIFAVVVSPDLVSNIFDTEGEVVNYGDHLSRVGGIGLTKHYFLFFFRDVILFVYSFFDKTIFMAAMDYPTMNTAFGLILFGAIVFCSVLFAIKRKLWGDHILRLMLIYFWFVFLFFSLMRPGNNPSVANYIWIWVDVVIIPAVVLVAFLISRLAMPWKHVSIVLVGIGIIYSSFNVLYLRLDMASHSVNFIPEFIGKSDGEMAAVQAHINYCYLCDRDANFELIDIGILQNDGETLISAFATGDVEGAVKGTKDAYFKLRTVVDHDATLWVGRIYKTSYRISGFAGEPESIVGIVRVRKTPTQNMPPIFWAN